MKKSIKPDLSKKAFKKAFGPQSTKEIIAIVEKSIQNKHLRKDIVTFIKAVDGKKIRNTSGI